jgi:hypothetical protein
MLLLHHLVVWDGGPAVGGERWSGIQVQQQAPHLLAQPLRRIFRLLLSAVVIMFFLAAIFFCLFSYLTGIFSVLFNSYSFLFYLAAISFCLI